MTSKHFAVAATLVVAGCAALQASKKLPGRIENGEFKPERPPAERYGADPKLTCPEFGANGALEDELGHRAKDGKRAKPDGRLCAVAETLLGWTTTAEGEVPPESIRSFVSQYFGIPGTVRRVLNTNVETEEPKNVATAVADTLTSFAAEAQQPLYGMMTERVKSTSAGGMRGGSAPKGSTHVVVVMFDALAEIDPLPRRIEANSAATLSGTVGGKLANPRIEVVDPVGKLVKPESQPGKAFKAELKCADRPGKMLIQIVAEKEGADSLVTNFPVWCALPPPLAAKVPAATTGPVDVAAAEKQLVEMINADRTTAGLKPVNMLPALSEIARNLAQSRAQGKGVTSTELTNALKDADIAAPVILESMAQAFTIEDVYTRFSDSPSDRSNMLNADITDVGVGVVPGPAVGAKPTFIVAELFVKQRAAIDAAQVKSKLYAAIAKKRADAKVPPATKDATLEGVAQAYADAAAANGGRPTKEQETEILAPLYKESMTVNQIGGFLPDESTAIEVAEQPGVIGSAKLVGVGIAIGRSPQFGKGSPFVMVLLGTRHEAPKRARQPARRKK